MFTQDLDFFPSRIPVPGAEKAPDPGSATLLLLATKIISSLTDHTEQNGYRYSIIKEKKQDLKKKNR
jgi:hypothetical protein